MAFTEVDRLTLTVAVAGEAPPPTPPALNIDSMIGMMMTVMMMTMMMKTMEGV